MYFVVVPSVCVCVCIEKKKIETRLEMLCDNNRETNKHIWSKLFGNNVNLMRSICRNSNDRHALRFK